MGLSDILGVAVALLLIAALVWDNRHHPGAWHEEDEHHP